MLATSEIQTPEIAEVVAQIEEVGRQLKEVVVEREYGAILGDDFSGRIPAWIIGKGVNQFYEWMGVEPVPVGHYHRSNHPDIRRFLKQTPSDKKVLVVTEAIHSGEALWEYRQTCERFGRFIDAATLTCKNNPEEYRGWNILKGGRLFAGKVGTSRSPLYGQRHLIGVTTTLRGYSIVDVLDPYSAHHLDRTQSDVEVLAQRVADILAS